MAKEPMMLPTNRIITRDSTIHFRRRENSSTLVYAALTAFNFFSSLVTFLVTILEATMGTRVRAMIKLASSEYAMVRPMSVKICLEIGRASCRERVEMLVLVG